MTKRSAPSSPVEQVAPKKQKLEDTTDDTPVAPPTPATTPNAPETAGTVDVATTAVAVAEPANIDVDMTDDDTAEEVAKPQTKGKGKATPKKKAAPKKPPVEQAFTPWKPDVTLPAADPFWGVKPVTGDAVPHPDQPSARDSDAATNPPLWEDLKFRFKRGSRYVKYFGPIAPEDAQDGPDLDQEDLLVIKLIDMRPKSKHDKTPRRVPQSYAYEHGKPKDWNDMQAVKALNDRRGQAIDRVTLDAPWSRIEREYLADIFSEYPDASIWEITMRHNDRFKDKESIADTGFAFAPLSTGRTVESVRHQYMTYKPCYDKGEAPEGVRFRNDNSLAGKALRASKKVENAFGKPNKALEKEFDEKSGGRAEGEDADGSGDETETTPKKTPAKKATKAKATTTKKAAPKKSAATIEESEDEDEAPVLPMKEQPKLSAEEEELWELAGGSEEGEHRASPLVPHRKPDFPPYTDSPLTDIGSDSPVPPSDDLEMTDVEEPAVQADNNTGETKALPPRASSAIDFPPYTDSPLTDLGSKSPVPPSDDEDEAAVIVDQMVSETVDALINQAVQHAKTEKQVPAVQDFQFPSQDADSEEEPAVVTETIEATVGIQVEVTTTTQEALAPTIQEAVAPITQEAVVPTATHAPLHGARHMSFDDNYDDDDEL